MVRSDAAELERTYPRLDILTFIYESDCGSEGKDCRSSTEHEGTEDNSNLMCAAKSSMPLVLNWTNFSQ
jgi:hypothetical protein